MGYEIVEYKGYTFKVWEKSFALANGNASSMPWKVDHKPNNDDFYHYVNAIEIGQRLKQEEIKNVLGIKLR